MAIGDYEVSANDTLDDIDFLLSSNISNEGSRDQQDLIFEISSTLETIRKLYKEKNPESFSYYFDQLLGIAQVGLVGSNCQPALSKRAVNQIKVEIAAREGAKVKNAYLIKLGSRSILLGAPAILIAWFLRYFFNDAKISSDVLTITINILYLWSGSMLGVWLSFSIVRTTIGFEDLVNIEKDGLEPTIRLLFTGSLGVIIGLFFIKGAMSIKLGLLSSDHVKDDAVTAFLIGVILGLNEKILGNTITNKTSELFQKTKYQNDGT